jgi:hypothetical protein
MAILHNTWCHPTIMATNIDPSRTLLLDVEKQLEANLMEWSACLNFEMDKDALGELEEYDICQFIGKYKGEVKFQLYFDRTKYKPPPMDSKKKKNIPLSMRLI